MLLLDTLASFLLLLTLSSAGDTGPINGSPPNPSTSASPCGGDSCDSPSSALAAALRAWDNSTTGAGFWEQAERNLESCVSRAASVVATETQRSVSQAQACIDYLGVTLEPQIRYALGNLTAKKAPIKAAGLYSQAQTDLKNLRNLTDTFGASVLKKTPSAQSSAAQSALITLDKDFNAAIASFA